MLLVDGVGDTLGLGISSSESRSLPNGFKLELRGGFEILQPLVVAFVWVLLSSSESRSLPNGLRDALLVFLLSSGFKSTGRGTSGSSSSSPNGFLSSG